MNIIDILFYAFSVLYIVLALLVAVGEVYCVSRHPEWKGVLAYAAIFFWFFLALVFLGAGMAIQFALFQDLPWWGEPLKLLAACALPVVCACRSFKRTDMVITGLDYDLAAGKRRL